MGRIPVVRKYVKEVSDKRKMCQQGLEILNLWEKQTITSVTLAFIFTIVINIPSHPLCFVHPLKCHLKEKSVLGCTKLKSLQLTGCPQISSAALTEVLLKLRDLRYLASEKIGLIFKNQTVLEAGKIFKIQNFEFNVSSHEPETLDLKDSDKHYVEKLSSVCPYLRTVKLNINKESLREKKPLFSKRLIL